MNKVFVVILNWNQPDLTIECLESVEKLLVTNYQLSIIVVDNHSDDDSLSQLKRFQEHNKNLKIIENASNLGFAAGNNVGIKRALEYKADYVMVLNNDTRVHSKLINQLLDTAKKYPNFGAASPKIYFDKGFEFHKEKYKNSDLGKVIWYAGGKIDWANIYGSGQGVDEVDKGQYDKTEETDYATGTCVFFSRQALEKTGLFNEKYFMYYEDTELSIRLKNAGFKVLYVPKAVVWHKVAQSSGIGSGLNDYYITRNRLLFGMRYSRFQTRFALYRESLKFLFSGRPWQKRGVLDFYFGNLYKGSWH
jgi:GT2 family glycosyltransferase